MKEGAARAVLREAWLRGQRCVELQRDGKRTIFVCTRCGTRCYSDAALVDHLQGNMHARRSVALTTTTASEKNSAGNGNNRDNSVEEQQQQRRGAIILAAHQDEQRALVARGGRGSELEEQRAGGGNDGDGGAATTREFIRGGAKIVLVDPRPSITIAGGGSRTSLEWIGSGELFFSIRSSAGTANTSAAPVVDSSWFIWNGKGGSGGPGLGSGSGCEVVGQQGGGGGGAGGHIAYAVIKFPYSDMIGRGGDWKPTWSSNPDSKHQQHQSRSSSSSYGMGQQPAEERLLVSLPTQTPTNSLKVNNNTGDTNSTHGPMHQQALAVLPFPNRNNLPQPPSSGETSSVVDKSVSPSPELGLLEKQHKLVGLGKGTTGSNRILRRVCKRKKAKTVERLCFICHQRMSSGKDVAALLNLHTKQMVCGSRNKRGVFHVYHSSCLIDWISMCEVKTFTGQVDHRIDHTRKLTRTRRAIVEQSLNAVIQGGDGGGPLSTSISEGAIFCPECQGTGLKLRGAQLERPRYRLAQVFDWILELIQARKAWTDNPNKQDTSRWGLFFHEDHQQGTVQSRGLVHYYSGCADLLTGNALERLTLTTQTAYGLCVNVLPESISKSLFWEHSIIRELTHSCDHNGHTANGDYVSEQVSSLVKSTLLLTCQVHQGRGCVYLLGKLHMHETLKDRARPTIPSEGLCLASNVFKSARGPVFGSSEQNYDKRMSYFNSVLGYPHRKRLE